MEFKYTYNYLYRITNNINGKFYIGIHSTNNLNDNYFGSGTLIKKAIQKYGINNFTKEILEFKNSREEIKNLEKKVVNDELLNNPLCYNIQRGGGGGQSVEMAKKHREKWSGFKGLKHTDEYKQKMSDLNKGKKLSEETKRKISETQKGHKPTEETCKKISNACSGSKNGFYGKHHSEETKRKISETKKQKYLLNIEKTHKN